MIPAVIGQENTPLSTSRKGVLQKQNAFSEESELGQVVSVTVMLGLVWALDRHIKVARLLRRQLR